MISETDPTARRISARLFSIAFIALFLYGVLALVSQAQVTTAIMPDGTLGSTVTQAENVYNIDGGTIKGSNQFHSLSLFTVGTGDVASFNGPSSISNILSRVTGGVISSIDGTIQTTIPGANLFVMNPAGMVFGPNALLDVSGAVHFTTADYLRLADNVRFTALPGPSDAMLTSAPVVAFGFLGPTPAGITIDQSVLEVPDDATLSVIGGNVEITGGAAGFLSARGGRINLASVASQGEVIPNVPGRAPDLQVDSFGRLGSVTLSNDALLNASGDSGGTVIIRGGRLEVDQSNVFVDTQGDLDGASVGVDIDVIGDVVVKDSSMTTDVLGAGNAGDIRLKAGNVHLIGSPTNDPDNASTRIGSISDFNEVGAIGQAGSVEVMTGGLQIDGVAEISSGTLGPGSGGDIEVRADNVSISGDRAGIFTNTFGSGAGGRIQLTADNLTLTNQAAIEAGSADAGKAGGIVLSLTDKLDIRTGSLLLVDSDGSGSAGDLIITAKNLSITGIRDATNPDAPGQFTGIDSSAASTGPGGNVQITATNFTVTDKGRIRSDTRGSGRGGNVKVTAGGITMTEGASITAESTSTGEAGNITLKSESSILLDKSNVTTEARLASGGNIDLLAPNVVRFNNSQVTSSVMGDPKTVGGNITIDPNFVVLQNSQIVARAAQGQGGNINITTDALLADANSVIDASSQFGVSGTVTVQSPTSNLSEALSPLPEGVLSAAALLRARCAALKQEGNVSSFTEQGRDSLPSGPGGLAPSPLLFGKRSVAFPFLDSHTPRPNLHQPSRLGDMLGSVKWVIPDRIVLTNLTQGCSS